jgi:hypothetical protein
VGASQFESPAFLGPDGRIEVHGPEQFDAVTGSQRAAYFFVLVQDGVVVKGKGAGSGSIWQGTTDEGQAPLRPGPVLATGLAVLLSMDDPPGFMTYSWSDQIELEAVSPPT